MPDSVNFLPVQLVHATKEVYTRPSTRLIFLDIVCDTDRELPETKLEQLETLLEEAIQRRFITFHDLDKLAGIYTSMSVAIPPASLYTYHMYKKVS